jgi:hypothetical protein
MRAVSSEDGLEGAVETAHEAGCLPDAQPSTLVEAVRREVGGEPVHTKRLIDQRRVPPAQQASGAKTGATGSAVLNTHPFKISLDPLNSNVARSRRQTTICNKVRQKRRPPDVTPTSAPAFGMLCERFPAVAAFRMTLSHAAAILAIRRWSCP